MTENSPTTRQIQGMGWNRDLPDHRDLLYSAPLISDIPTSIDLRPKLSPVYDQGPAGSCTAQAIAAAIEYETTRQGEPDFMPSRLFIYYGERQIEGTIPYDAGASIRDGIKFVNSSGVCPESEWPYDISQLTVRPSDSCWTDANTHMALQYESVIQTLDQMKGCLAQEKPIVMGFSVFQSFESAQVAQTGIVPMPQPNESMLGGHAILVVGFNDAIQMFLCRNSWGSNWSPSLQGHFWIPYSYFTDPDLADDLWTITRVS